MAKYRQALEQTAIHSNSLEIAVERTKNDLIWIVLGIVVAIGSGLAIGNLFSF